MKVFCVVLVCCCAPALCDAATFMKTVGEDFRFSFGFNRSQTGAGLLCRNSCRSDDVLMVAEGGGAKSGRYEVRYEDGEDRVQLVIRELRRSDSGRYRYAEVDSASPRPHLDFEIRVRGMCAGGVISAEPRVHSSTEGGNVTVRCSLNAARRDRKFFYRTDQEETLVEAFGGRAASSRFSIQHDGGRTFSLTITGLKMSDSGRYRCGVGGPNAYNTCLEFEIQVSGPFILSRVGCLMVVVLFLIFLLLLYSWRMKKSHSQS
ncbi:uncharacterized protein LOC103361529 isoform X2 [Stegastes partitus]|uniref:Uncharacterized protein LOC103361529 isoform X2 n=1 Tax=Stegastes partitus TaxID=144197 RepID=A0A9Y4N5P9_9TELE|nr:PREDICTED: uncharacterized protein LOC103361529 isoform X2 [Stegastes partitus]